jgi:hypothetical protein
VTDLIGRYGQPGLAAFAAQVGDVVGPFSTGGVGAYLFKIEAREERPISEEAYQLALDQAFNNWLLGLRDESEVTIVEDWQSFLPPAVPLNF